VAAALSAALFLSSAAAALSAADQDTVDSLLFGGSVCVTPRSVATLEECAESAECAAPGMDEVVAVFSEGFSQQDARLYINGMAYPFHTVFHGGELYVLPSEFLPETEDADLVCDDGSTCCVAGDGFEFASSVGDVYFTVNGRCFFCGGGVSFDFGCVSVPLEPLISAFGLDLSLKEGDFFVLGEASEIERAEEYYPADDLYWLSRIISCESMSESILGKIAVGNVVMNRVASDEFPGDVKGVVFDSRYGVVQFSPVAGGNIYKEPDSESVVAAKLCLEGVSLSGEILYFMNPALATTDWISENREAVMTIGNHTFYS
jgi:N-acetylmuramoyl-L-alanine amidase